MIAEGAGGQKNKGRRVNEADDEKGSNGRRRKREAET